MVCNFDNALRLRGPPALSGTLCAPYRERAPQPPHPHFSDENRQKKDEIRKTKKMRSVFSDASLLQRGIFSNESSRSFPERSLTFVYSASVSVGIGYRLSYFVVHR